MSFIYDGQAVASGLRKLCTWQLWEVSLLQSETIGLPGELNGYGPILTYPYEP